MERDVYYSLGGFLGREVRARVHPDDRTGRPTVWLHVGDLGLAMEVSQAEEVLTRLAAAVDQAKGLG